MLFAQARPPESVRDSVGAGDTFIGAFLYAWKKKYCLQKCLDWGCIVAGHKVGHLGFGCVSKFAGGELLDSLGDVQSTL